ncbi:hypothetical protein PHYPSEUDO_000743 [Phytophthora pseudosyringae]|uniref:Uncharacterized protein n=1 Tax=Phytophthora pseudosyringae TaxID=221518 RepID=A0A8T1WGL0_9STRA|nr:hypothetical protein PHYPSEUDO_000743 [Phytophthora pseudosyringae]
MFACPSITAFPCFAFNVLLQTSEVIDRDPTQAPSSHPQVNALQPLSLRREHGRSGVGLLFERCKVSLTPLFVCPGDRYSNAEGIL